MQTANERTDFMTITKRGFVRVISFSAGIVAALTISAGLSYGREQQARRSLEYTYLRAIEELSLNLDNIKNDLEKGMYTNSVSMLSDLSGKLCSDAATAKTALSQLPVEELNLERTYRFLSQVGNYSKSLAEKCANGERLTDEERSNIAALYEYAGRLSGSMWEVEEQVRSGEITFSRARSASAAGADGGGAVSVTDGFQNLENSDNSYPSLIYDGPFSDHILEKNPLTLENEPEISKEEALSRALMLTDGEQLTESGEEAGKMPSYVFENEKTTIAVTKAGGYYSYMLSDRQIGEQKITADEAMELAEDFLEKIGIKDAEDTYYEIQRGVCVVNLAAEQDDVILYTDLIKVGVALDNGEILSFDLRGYLTNHAVRTLPEPKISEAEAISLISSELEALDASLCVIPSSGQNEVFCYEVKCVSGSGQNVLVYINAVTGQEEQLLLLKIGSGGVLTV